MLKLKQISSSFFFFLLLILNLSLESADFFTHDAIARMMLVKCIAIRCDQVRKHILETNFIVIHFCCPETLFPAIFPQMFESMTSP